jgi:hypothetical protein
VTLGFGSNLQMRHLINREMGGIECLPV